MCKSQALNETRVRFAVEAKLREILCNRNAEIRGQDRFIADLKVDSDDLSFIFIPELESELGVSLPQETWSKVESVDDVVEQLSKALGSL